MLSRNRTTMTTVLTVWSHVAQLNHIKCFCRAHVKCVGHHFHAIDAVDFVRP